VKRIVHQEYAERVRDARVLSRDRHGDKVLETPDGHIIKLFRLKRLWSTALWDPYAKRFQRAAVRLAALDLPTVEVLELFRVEGTRKDGVLYRPLAGTPLREALAEGWDAQGLLEAFAAFLAMLHGKGVYFRAIHFMNVLVLEGGGLGLIDVSETRFASRPLGPARRSRNFKPLVRYEVDRRALERFGVARFVASYLGHANLAPRVQRRFLRLLARRHPAFESVLLLR
jgi:hypothetical protein